MKRINHHLLRIFRILIVFLFFFAFAIFGLWVSGWFDEMVLSHSGYQEGSEAFRGGLYYNYMKGEEYDISIVFTSIDGIAKVQIYDINMDTKDLTGSVEQLMNQFTLVEEIEVTEPTTIEVELSQYPTNRCYYITVSGEKCQYEYEQSFTVWKSRWKKYLDELL